MKFLIFKGGVEVYKTRCVSIIDFEINSSNYAHYAPKEIDI